MTYESTYYFRFNFSSGYFVKGYSFVTVVKLDKPYDRRSYDDEHRTREGGRKEWFVL